MHECWYPAETVEVSRACAGFAAKTTAVIAVAKELLSEDFRWTLLLLELPALLPLLEAAMMQTPARRKPLRLRSAIVNSCEEAIVDRP